MRTMFALLKLIFDQIPVLKAAGQDVTLLLEVSRTALDETRLYLAKGKGDPQWDELDALWQALAAPPAP